MKDLVDQLIKQLGVNESQARSGAGVILKAARDKLGAAHFEDVLGSKVAGLNDLLRSAPAEGGVGKLFGGVASMLGGNNAAILASVVTGFGKLGLTADHAKRFLPVMIDFLRSKVGHDTIDELEKALRSGS
jgi:hypothetical protein